VLDRQRTRTNGKPCLAFRLADKKVLGPLLDAVAGPAAPGRMIVRSEENVMLRGSGQGPDAGAKRDGGRDEDRHPRTTTSGVAWNTGRLTALPNDAEIRLPPGNTAGGASSTELSDYEDRRHHSAAGALSRAVLDGLPNLKLIVCNGRRAMSVDHEARGSSGGIQLCGSSGDRGGAPPCGPLRDETPRGLPTPSEMAWAAHLRRCEADWLLRTGSSAPVAGRRGSHPDGGEDPGPSLARATSAERWSRSRRRWNGRRRLEPRT